MLPTNGGIFHTDKDYLEVKKNYKEAEDHFAELVKNGGNIKKEEQIEIPIPKHHWCAVCLERFKDYIAHIASEEHKKKVNSQEDYLS